MGSGFMVGLIRRANRRVARCLLCFAIQPRATGLLPLQVLAADGVRLLLHIASTFLAGIKGKGEVRRLACSCSARWSWHAGAPQQPCCCPCLLATVALLCAKAPWSPTVMCAGKGGKKKAEGDGKAPAKQGARGAAAEPPPPPNYADIAVCNSTGALHHLTFLDEAKLEVGSWGSSWAFLPPSLG